MKPGKRRLDVNLDELDQVLAGAGQAPRSEADYDKLKDAPHAMAALLTRSRNTEKTSAVTGEAAVGDAAENERPPAAGHGRKAASAFVGAPRIEIEHPNLKHSDRCPACGQGNVYTQKEPKVLVRIVGQAPLAATVYSLERLRCGAWGARVAAVPGAAGEVGGGGGAGGGEGASARRGQIGQGVSFPPAPGPEIPAR